MCRKLRCRAGSRTRAWWAAILGPTTRSHLKDVLSFVCGFILKWQMPHPFWSTSFSEPLLESVAIAKPLSLSLDSSRCSCPCLCRPSPIRVLLCSSFPFPPGSHSHLALSQHRYWSGSFNFQPEELWWAGGEAAGGSETSWAQAGTMQWACM